MGAYKDNPIQLSRLRAAWVAASRALTRTQSPTERVDNVEEPLGDGTKEELDKALEASHPNIQFDEHVTGADSVTARNYREFRRKTNSVQSMMRVKALAWDRRPNATTRPSDI